MLMGWIHTTRYVYNRTLHHLKTDDEAEWNAIKLKKKFVTRKYRNGEINPNIRDWELDTPKDVRDGGIRDLTKAYEIAIKNVKRCNIQRFQMRYRKRDKNSSIVIPKSAVSFQGKKLKMYTRYLKTPITIAQDRCLRKLTSIDHDCRLQYKFGKWYLIVPFKQKCDMKTGIKTGVCALDPGTRKFQTVYSADEVIKVVHNKKLVTRLRCKLDLLRSLRDKKQIPKNHYDRTARKIYEKLSNITDELHYQTIAYLCDKYRLILIPIFESQEIAKKSRNRYLNRDLTQLQHYKFRKRLEDKCALLRYTDVEVVSEAYTSKTCSNCGNQNHDLKTNEVYDCSGCGMVIDRDVNGSKNILLRHYNFC
jgi:transposase